DRYRQAVEKLSRGSKWGEVEVARQAVALAGRGWAAGGGGGEAPARAHGRYSLVDKGRPELEGLLHYRPKMRDRFLNFLLAHPRLVYFGGVALVVLAVLAGLGAYAAGPGGGAVGLV